MDDNKSKPVTTSVPSISVKFHVNAEEIEELYVSDDEQNLKNDFRDKTPSPSITLQSGSGETDSSPLRYLPRLVKRSTSVDVSNAPQDSSPPASDPWRFFSDIKGKITKSVEEKITEIKSRNQEEGSPSHHNKHRTFKEESSSVSESEDISESSISKTCGLVSTTEGVEMSSDEETPALEKDAKTTLRQRFRILRNRSRIRDGSVKIDDFAKLFNVESKKEEQTTKENAWEYVENAVDALEETSEVLKEETVFKSLDPDLISKNISDKFDNVELDDENILNFEEITGEEVRQRFFDKNHSVSSVFAPTGFVDLRPEFRGKSKKKIVKDTFNSYKWCLVAALTSLVIGFLQLYSPFVAGLIIGALLTFIFMKIQSKIVLMSTTSDLKNIKNFNTDLSPKILEVQAAKEYQPMIKYEGWVNEYPRKYDPLTYHIFQTQPVFLKLQGHLLRISHTSSRVPKRATWNESEVNVNNLGPHRTYNMLGAKVSLLPKGLARKRFWSKKYPICIEMSKDQMNFETCLESEDDFKDDKKVESEKCLKNSNEEEKKKEKAVSKEKKQRFRFRAKHEYPALAQKFSRVNEGEEIDLDSDSRASTPSAEYSEIVEHGENQSSVEEIKDNNKEEQSLQDELSPQSQENKDSNEIKIYIFARTDREKEDWFRRLSISTRKDSATYSRNSFEATEPKVEENDLKSEYKKYMKLLLKGQKIRAKSIGDIKKETEKEKDKHSNIEPADLKNATANENKALINKVEEELASEETSAYWLNALIGRVLFDCSRDPNFTEKVKERIQRKLHTIKLPQFIKEILVPELSLGKTPFFIKKCGIPSVDERGLWIDLDFSYEGTILLTLQARLNLMRKKESHNTDKVEFPEVKSAIYHSDVDDSAESSSDEEASQDVSGPLPENVPPSSRKKLIKMVDKFAESKFFRVASENRYIKKAMEGVSNTDLRLTVEVKSVTGTLVLNVPPPPSDRIWLGFRAVPEISLSAKPIVGEWNFSYIMVTNWIEKKLLQEFQKVMVLPNMEDFVIPLMDPELP